MQLAVVAEGLDGVSIEILPIGRSDELRADAALDVTGGGKAERLGSSNGRVTVDVHV